MILEDIYEEISNVCSLENFEKLYDYSTDDSKKIWGDDYRYYKW